MNSVLLHTIIKNFFIIIYINYIYIKINNIKNTKIKQFIAIIISSIFISIIYSITKKYINSILAIIISYFLISEFIHILLKNSIGNVMISTIIAGSVCLITFEISLVFVFIIQRILYITNNIINSFIIAIIQAILIFLFFRIKRFSKGFNFLQNKVQSDYLDIIMINISAVVIFAYCLFGNYYGNLTRHIFITFIAIGIIMIVMIQKTLVLCYKQQLQEKTIKQYEEDLKEKDLIIAKNEKEKYKISKVNHEFYNRQKALELKVNEMSKNFDTEFADELNQIKNISKEYSKKLENARSSDNLQSTEITEIDDMFKYMQSECKNNNIDFNLQICGNIHYMVNNLIPQDKLVTLIGDILRDAIIATSLSENSYKSIISMLGIRNGIYEFSVSDTGVEFKIDTLLKLGLEPITTHKETGGSGIGFMTTFETMKKCMASLVIEEKHKMIDNDYTKTIKILFDGKNEYRINSYRAEEIQEKNRDHRLIMSS